MATGGRMVTAPFQAEIEEVVVVVHEDGYRRESRRAGRIYRDGHGRLRQELLIPIDGIEARVALLADPATHVAVLVDAASGTTLARLPEVMGSHAALPVGLEETLDLGGLVLADETLFLERDGGELIFEPAV